jgi:3-hydroxyacyl-[acyl-carrier-protein] dehydratase
MVLNKKQIKEIIPYDEPFLFVDGVKEIGENTISGFYQTSKDDYYFKGHFVDFKIMPGVLVIEALAQLSTIFLRKKMGEVHKKYHFLAYDVRGAQFYKPIFPGDKIILKDEILSLIENKIAHIKGQALIPRAAAKGEDGRSSSTGDDLKCEARFLVAIVDKEEFERKYGK